MIPRYLQESQHPCIAEGVWLDSCQVEEFGDTLIVGTSQFGVNDGIDNLVANLSETVTRKKVDLEREAEEAGKAQLASIRFEAQHEGVTNTFSKPLVINGKRADFAEVLPHDVEGAATDRGAVGIFDDTKLLNSFVDRDVFFAEEDALGNERGGEGLDPRDVGRAGASDDER